MKNVQAAELDSNGTGDGEERTVGGGAERIATVAPWVACAEKLYLALRKKYSLENVIRRLGAVLDCYVACC